MRKALCFILTVLLIVLLPLNMAGYRPMGFAETEPLDTESAEETGLPVEEQSPETPAPGSGAEESRTAEDGTAPLPEQPEPDPVDAEASPETEQPPRDDQVEDVPESQPDAAETEAEAHTEEPAEAENTDASGEPSEIEENESDGADTAIPEDDAEQADAPAWDDELVLDKKWQRHLTKDDPMVTLHLTLRRFETVEFQTEGLPVTLRITSLQTGSYREFRPGKQGDEWLPHTQTLQMQEGEYIIRLEPVQKNVEGLCSLTVRRTDAPQGTEGTEETAETGEADVQEEAAETSDPSGDESENVETSDTRTEALTDDSAGVPESVPPEQQETEAQPEPQDEPTADKETTADPDGTDGAAAEDVQERMDTAEPGETEAPANDERTAEEADAADPEETTDAEDPDAASEDDGTEPTETETEEAEGEQGEPSAEGEPGEAAAEAENPDAGEEAEAVEIADGTVPTERDESPIRVTVTASLDAEDTAESGATVILRAEVQGCDPEDVRIQWQYSPDGGETVFTVPDADGMEYRFQVDEQNILYVWRAVATRAEAPEASSVDDE